MDPELKKTEEDTANILLEYVSIESVEDQSSKYNGAKSCSNNRERTKSVEKAKALLRDACKRDTPSDTQQPEPSSTKVTITQTEIDGGFVFVSTSSSVRVQARPPAATRDTCQNNHLSATCGAKGTTDSVKRPGTLCLQPPSPSADPGDPPLFSPSQSYPPGPSKAGRMPIYLSSPVLTNTCSPKIVRAGNCTQGRANKSTSGLSPLQRHCHASPSPQNTASSSDTAQTSIRVRSRLIAERLKVIGDSIDKEHNNNDVEDNLSSLISSLMNGMSTPYNFWHKVTEIFRNFYRLLALLNSEFNGKNPPADDQRWQLFLKTVGLLRHDIIPWISSSGGWGAFLRVTEPEHHGMTIPRPRSDMFPNHPLISSPLLPRNSPRCLRGTHRDVPTTHSTPTLPRCEVRTAGSRIMQTVSPRLPTASYSRAFQDFQNSPGSTRALRINRSQTLPINKHTGSQTKLWRLSESGSLVDEDGNEDFEKSFTQSCESVSESEASRLSLEGAVKIVETSSQLSDSDQERDEMVFQMQSDDPPTTPPPSAHIRLTDVQHTMGSISSPVIVVAGHSQENVEQEYLCDSGIVSSLETLSRSSTPPPDVVFAIGNTQLHSSTPFSDSAVDVSSPQTPSENSTQKRRPRSGCSFKKDKDEPFDRERSRSVPMSRRPKSAGNEKKYGHLQPRKLATRESSRRQAMVVSSAPPCENSYSSGSVSLGISEAVLYEAVCSLLRS